MNQRDARSDGGQTSLQHCIEVLGHCEQVMARHPGDPVLRHLAAELCHQIEITQRLISRRARSRTTRAAE